MKEIREIKDIEKTLRLKSSPIVMLILKVNTGNYFQGERAMGFIVKQKGKRL